VARGAGHIKFTAFPAVRFRERERERERERAKTVLAQSKIALNFVGMI
jgi:hypothetical protein